MTCKSCAQTRQPQDGKLREWMDRRGLMFCLALTKQAKQKMIITLNNSAGMPCLGKFYQPQEQTELFE